MGGYVALSHVAATKPITLAEFFSGFESASQMRSQRGPLPFEVRALKNGSLILRERAAAFCFSDRSAKGESKISGKSGLGVQLSLVQPSVIAAERIGDCRLSHL